MTNQKLLKQQQLENRNLTFKFKFEIRKYSIVRCHIYSYNYQTKLYFIRAFDSLLPSFSRIQQTKIKIETYIYVNFTIKKNQSKYVLKFTYIYIYICLNLYFLFKRPPGIKGPPRIEDPGAFYCGRGFIVFFIKTAVNCRKLE